MADPFSGGIMPQVIQNRQGLQQLEAQRMEMDNMQRQQQMQDEGMALLEQYQAGLQSGKPDNNLLYSAVLKSPTAAQNVLNAVGIVDKQQKQQAAGDVVTLMSAIGNPQAFYKATAQRIAAIKARGGDPTDTIEMAKRYQAGDVEGVKNDLMIAGAALANEGLIKPELIGLGGGAEPMTAFQQASTDLRRQELEFNKAQKATELQLKTLEAAMKREDNDLKREDIKLKIQEQQQKLADMERQKQSTEREKTADLNQAFFGIDNMLNTVERIRQSPKLDSVVGTIQGRMDAYVDDEAAATIRLIENLGSQAFMAMIPGLKGMGALSNAEGDKLAASLQNISRVTSEEAFRETLSEIERLMGKSRKFIAERYGKPETKPDIPAAERAEQDIMAEYGL